MFPGLGKIFLMVGGFFILVGLVFLLVPHIPWLGHMPGDIRYHGKSVHVYFPITTCILVSILFTILLSLFGGWR